MNTARYFVALLTFVTVTAALPWWLVVHPLSKHLRRIGPARTFMIMIPFTVLLATGLYSVKDPFLAVEFGTNWVLIGVATMLYGFSAWIEIQCRRHLKLRILVGVPELSPYPAQRGSLITEGIYGRVRHPRYVSISIGMFAIALFTNYFITYVVTVVSWVALYLIVVLEERELRERFGEDYQRYSERVPRFVPK